MSHSRPSRQRSNGGAPERVASDSGGDTDNEEATPKPQRTLSRKRLSDVYDASFSPDSARAPFKSVNINDDAAEKRRRRQSAKITMAPLDDNEAGPSGEGSREEADPTRSVVPNRRKQVQTVEEPPRVDVSLDVMTSNFEQWMKMATDNKINANNSWDLALIDYFHDMSLLRNNADNSINFQRASYTLDGCMKIWTSRVDSVGSETGKLLSNLANEGRVGDEDEDEEGGEGGEGGSQTAKKRKGNRSGSTIAKDISQLRNKKLDVGFSVDPLFRKTSADFDEGGANGLLMNHLSLGVFPDGSLRVVFDAGDSIGRGDEDDAALEQPDEEIDLTEIRKHFMPSLDALEEQSICPSLEDFNFSKDAFAFNDVTMFKNTGDADDDDGDDDGPVPFNEGFEPPMDIDGLAEPAVEDFFVGDQAVHDDYVHDDEPVSPSVGSENAEAREQGAAGGSYVPFDPRRAPNDKDLVLAEGDGDIVFDYFDQAVVKNWAGPEHWKLRKVVRRPDATTEQPAKRRERKEAFKIDFITPSEKSIKDIAKELFAPVTKGAGITLPGTSSRKGTKGKKGKEKDERRNEHTLPDDMHFSSRQLVTLFLKPKFSLKMRGHRARLDERVEGDVDENFWARAAADQAAARADGEMDQTEDGGAIPFNTQFFQDDDDGPGFDDVDESGEGPITAGDDEQELLNSSRGPIRRVRPEFVNYAKRAKRVDVRKLKDNIWNNLDIVVPELNEEADAMDTDDQPATDPAEARVFDNVISGLRKSYPRDKMEEISTSFCFICLLHLANERGLRLETGAEEEAVDIDSRVGNIWDLKVYRDPHAIPAA